MDRGSLVGYSAWGLKEMEMIERQTLPEFFSTQFSG